MNFDDLAGKKVLIVEDNMINYLLIKEILDLFDMKIQHTTLGKESIEMATGNERADIILMDIKLPDISGYEAIKEIKRLNPKIPIIALTACALVEDRQACISAGCDSYISKPFASAHLLSSMSSLLNKKYQVSV